MSLNQSGIGPIAGPARGGAQHRSSAGSLFAIALLARKFSSVVRPSILMPVGLPAIGAARRNDVQKSINPAPGSSLATIGLTIPAVAIAAYELDKQLVGLSPREWCYRR